MITFKSNKDNDEYLIINPHYDLADLIFFKNLPIEVSKEVKKCVIKFIRLKSILT